MTKYVYDFVEGSAQLRDLLGGKGANLCEMARLGLPVPPGFVITTEACRQYYERGRQFPPGLWEEVREHLARLEEAVGRRLGDAEAPLLVSVRSGARFSMPGMMDTILNLGLNDATVQGLARLSGDERFALDAYRRFLQAFGRIVFGAPGEAFEEELARARAEAGVQSDAELGPDHLRRLIERFKAIIQEQTGQTVPDDPLQQLERAVRAVFESWNNQRAIAYREHHGIPHHLGTAVTVQAMVFGNLGWDSATGVAFSRSPADGTKELYGEYLPNAQGEDIVSGARTPKPIAEMAREFPQAYRELRETARRLEEHYRDVQDIEFTIERGKLYILQTRSAKRTALAALRSAVDMVQTGLITKEEALRRLPASQLPSLLMPRFLDQAKRRALAEGRLLGRGLAASPGAAVGRLALDLEGVRRLRQEGHEVVLVRPETSADDVPAILEATAVVTSRGGITSHAAVVTRGLGKPAVVGCSDIRVDPAWRRLYANGRQVAEGEEVSVDGFSGEVFLGPIAVVQPDIEQEGSLSLFLSWADEVRRLGVRANADTPADARRARHNGAEGIGLCRTEHMFFQPERLPYVRRVLAGLGGPQQDYEEALARLEGYQEEDFLAILEAMEGMPVTVRLLDAPLHEFLPPPDALERELAELRARGAPPEALQEREAYLEAYRRLEEANPMLGRRGCRLGVTQPEVYEMQVRAIVRAACRLRAQGREVHPQVMIPLVADVAELHFLRGRLERVAREVMQQEGQELEVPFGTMIEVPRAALVAEELAPEVEFFSFGSNDLTQMTYGFSRDDAPKFLPQYLEQGILRSDPFLHLDEKGVGRLIEMAVREGRAANPRLEVGLCGEHGGDPTSILFCHRVGLDYVSCSPYRVPVARLAAAQAALGLSAEDL
jgi:pyruvate,orthophosphate dikinase